MANVDKIGVVKSDDHLNINVGGYFISGNDEKIYRIDRNEMINLMAKASCLKIDLDKGKTNVSFVTNEPPRKFRWARQIVFLI